MAAQVGRRINDGASSTTRQRAINRLMRDLRELQEEPCRTVCAVPMENDIFCWHGNLCPSYGPYAGHVIHLIFNFEEDYPASPPEVRLCQRIPHPNVFGDYICLDMLKRDTSAEPYTGWSTAYSVQSILLQLQAFLFAENVPQEWGGTISAVRNNYEISLSKERITSFTCACGHSSLEPYPPLPEEDAFNPRTSESADEARSSEGEPFDEMAILVSLPEQPIQDECRILRIPMEIQLHILEYLQSRKDIISAVKACSSFASIIREYALLERLESVICFYSKRTMDEDILGVGVTPEYYPHDTSKVKAIHTSLDILSLGAFSNDHVRLSVWKKPFNAFLPLVLSPNHFRRARQLILSSLANLAGDAAHSRWNHDLKLQAQIVLRVLPKLMNSFVVSLMKSDDKLQERTRMFQPYQPQVIHTSDQMLSELALEGYCSFHHMLLMLASENPELEMMANAAVERFIHIPEERHKSRTPDLGEWLVYLTLARANWADVAESFINELFIRNSRWVLQESPSLESLAIHHAKKGAACLIDNTFLATRVSQRLVMFQVYFLTNIGRPQHQSWRETLGMYNRSMGKPTYSMKTRLHAASKAIVEVNSWAEFFDRIQVTRMNAQQLTSFIRSAFIASAALGYHRSQKVTGAGYPQDAERKMSLYLLSYPTPVSYLPSYSASSVGHTINRQNQPSYSGKRSRLDFALGSRRPELRFDNDRESKAKRQRRSRSRSPTGTPPERSPRASASDEGGYAKLTPRPSRNEKRHL